VRLWTVHPKYLDARGLVAVWREGLLARAVLRDRTLGYRHHPQLARFRARPDPVACLNAYLRVIYAEALGRGYRFDAAKLGRVLTRRQIPETRGQLAYEWAHLRGKLEQRDAERHQALVRARRPLAHPLFAIRPGPVRAWERAARKRGAGPPVRR
jgi:Pyrimidine dimer DNA glycosylase